MANVKTVSHLDVSKKKREEDENRPTKPKKLSKAGLWLQAHPHGCGGTYDLRAVMR